MKKNRHGTPMAVFPLLGKGMNPQTEDHVYLVGGERCAMPEVWV